MQMHIMPTIGLFINWNCSIPITVKQYNVQRTQCSLRGNGTNSLRLSSNITPFRIPIIVEHGFNCETSHAPSSPLRAQLTFKSSNLKQSRCETGSMSNCLKFRGTPSLIRGKFACNSEQFLCFSCQISC